MNKSIYGRRDRLVQEREHDVYHSRTKLPDPAVCNKCGAIYLKGRWVWGEAPLSANTATCPACRRIADRFPAGHIELQGTFFNEHREEILNLVHNIEEKEKANHPMERIMQIEQLPGGARVTTTGIHLARGIGSALSSAYNGETSTQYLDGESTVKVAWTR